MYVKFKIAREFEMKKYILILNLIYTNLIFSALIEKPHTNIAYSKEFYDKARASKEFSKQNFAKVVKQLEKLNAEIPKPSSDKLRVMTYNVHFFTDSQGNNSEKEILEVIEKTGPDILILEEAKTDNPVIGQLKKLGYEHSIFGSIDSNPKFGNMILSKYPFIKKEAFEFKSNDQIKHARIRSYLKTEIDMSKFGKKNILVYGTHLAIYTQVPGHNPANKIADDRIRVEEIDEIIKNVKDNDTDKNIIFGADFNSPRRGAPLNLLESAGFKTCLANISVPVFTCWVGSAIDHIYTFLKDLNVVGCYIYYSAASDHLPVIIDIRISEKTKKEDLRSKLKSLISKNPDLMKVIIENHLTVDKILDNINQYITPIGQTLLNFATVPLAPDVSNIEAANFFKLLLQYGAEINTQIKSNVAGVGGWTVLIWASQNGYVGLVKFLLENGANPKIKDANGKAAIDLALEKESASKSDDERAKFSSIIKLLEIR